MAGMRIFKGWFGAGVGYDGKNLLRVSGHANFNFGAFSLLLVCLLLTFTGCKC